MHSASKPRHQKAAQGLYHRRFVNQTNKATLISSFNPSRLILSDRVCYLSSSCWLHSMGFSCSAKRYTTFLNFFWRGRIFLSHSWSLSTSTIMMFVTTGWRESVFPALEMLLTLDQVQQPERKCVVREKNTKELMEKRECLVQHEDDLAELCTICKQRSPTIVCRASEGDNGKARVHWNHFVYVRLVSSPKNESGNLGQTAHAAFGCDPFRSLACFLHRDVSAAGHDCDPDSPSFFHTYKCKMPLFAISRW